MAYIIYTSGSTGVPKGVEVLHRGIARLVCNPDYVQLDQTQSVLQMAVLSFDASTFEIWGPLLNGGRCVLAPAHRADLAELQQLIQQKHIRTLWLTSTLFNTIVDDHVEALAGIEQLLVGGEALSVTHIRKAQQGLGPRTQLINGYGPTECTTFACCYRLPHTIPADCASIPIGRPISNTTAYVLDSQGEPVPIGVPGELYIGGDGVARDYLNQPELTAEKFLHDPFSPHPQARMYRTGDTVRWLPDGTIEFLGRRDQQVKLRGFRIELGEIEAALLRNPAISQAVVTLREDRPSDKQVVAYVVPSQFPPSNSSPQPCGERPGEGISSSLPNHNKPSTSTTAQGDSNLRTQLPPSNSSPRPCGERPGEGISSTLPNHNKPSTSTTAQADSNHPTQFPPSDSSPQPCGERPGEGISSTLPNHNKPSTSTTAQADSNHPSQFPPSNSSPQPCGERQGEGISSSVPIRGDSSSNPATLSARDLRQALQDQLPAYMIPSQFVILPQLPMTANGKVDKQALPQPGTDRPHPHHEFAAPRTPLEHHLVDIWSSMLRHKRIGIHDNFFELGGHSLLALRLIDTLNRSQDRKLKVGDLFSRPTIAELARLMTDTSSDSTNREGGTQRTYLESIRTGHRSTHVVIVGATVQAPLQDLPPGIPVWWLKLDGLHVLPHLDLDIKTQATEYLKELTEAIPRGRILFCGHSYGGLLAIEMAHQLGRNHQVELVLLEPSPVWQPPKSFTKRLTQHARSFHRPNRVDSVQNFLKSVSDKLAHKLLKRVVPRRHHHGKTRETDDQFQKMVPHFRRHIRGYQFPQPFTHDVHLIGTPDYLKTSVHGLKPLTSGTVMSHAVPASLSHLDVALPENNQFWVTVINQLIHENERSASRH